MEPRARNSLTRPLALALALVLAHVGCGGYVSLGDDERGRNPMVAGEQLGDAGPDALGDVAASEAAPAVLVPADFPGQGSALDGGLDHPAAGAFNQLVWSRWWGCGGAVCVQQMWINADCTVHWNDRDVLVGTGTMDAVDCADLQTNASTYDLPGALASAPALGSPVGAAGGETLEWHTGGPGGPWARARTELVSTGAAIPMARKYVAVGTRSIAGARESDPHLP